MKKFKLNSINSILQIKLLKFTRINSNDQINLFKFYLQLYKFDCSNLIVKIKLFKFTRTRIVQAKLSKANCTNQIIHIQIKF